jgi:putative tryptophan/tyrosine transport system substrate-binding protein
MRRRDFITLVSGLAASLPLSVGAQVTRSTPKIGWLKIQGPQHTPEQLQAFREGMRALGMLEGRDFVLEERYADGDEARLTNLAAELISSGVSIILATSQPSIAAAWRVTKTVPVIGRMVDDPVTDGMALSLARPGGNVTGVYTMTRK